MRSVSSGAGTGPSRFGASGVQSHVSIKLTALGFDLGDELCRANVVRILTKAKAIGTLVTIERKDVGVTLELTPQVLVLPLWFLF